MFPNLIVFNTVTELHHFLDNNHDDKGHTQYYSLVGVAAFAGDLLSLVRSNGGVYEIVDPVDDGGWIEIDDDGYVASDFAIC